MNAAPWKLRFTGQNHNSDKVVIQIIANDGVIVVDNEQYYPAALDPQNAATITAAPTMLEALRNINTRLSNPHPYDPQPNPEIKDIVEFALGIYANLEAKVKAVTEG